jgi:hypothetical protein
MEDNIRRIGQSEKFKKLCNDLRAKGIKKTDAEIIEVSMTLLKRQFLQCFSCKNYEKHTMNPDKIGRCPDFEKK